MKSFYRRIKRKNAIVNGVSVDRVEHCYNVVCSHLRKVGSYKQTNRKFPPRALYAAVKQVLEHSPSEPLDIAVDFEGLRDYSTIQAFLESLAEQHTITKGYTDESLADYALEELTEKAEILGKQIADKNEVVLSQNEYAWLKICECTYKNTSTTGRLISVKGLNL